MHSGGTGHILHYLKMSSKVYLHFSVYFCIPSVGLWTIWEEVTYAIVSTAADSHFPVQQDVH